MEIRETKEQLTVNNACIDGSAFTDVSLKDCIFDNVTLAGVKITNANMSDLEIDGAQLGGAYIHHIGMPPEDHPQYDPAAKQRPLRFEDCELEGSVFEKCNFKNTKLNSCNLEGMKIDGIEVNELLKAYKKA